MLEWLTLLMEHWPTVGLIATLLIGVYLVARYLSQAEVRDMRRRIDYLDEQVAALRYRDECYFDFVVYAESYYNRLELLASAHNFALEPRLSFLEFRHKWMKERELTDEWERIWK